MNGDLKPEDFALFSHKKVWWQCSKDHTHEWFASIANRTNLGRGCPECKKNKTGIKPSEENNLSLHPVAKEFHYEKNYPLTPNDFTLYSHKKTWWICEKGHEWEAIIKNRTKDKRPTKCEECYKYGSSIQEQEILEYIRKITDYEVIPRFRINRKEADIFIPARKVAIEYNGIYYHSEKFKGSKYHLNKFKHFKERGIDLIYIWEDEWHKNTSRCISLIKDVIEGHIHLEWNGNITKSTCVDPNGVSHQVWGRNDFVVKYIKKK